MASPPQRTEKPELESLRPESHGIDPRNCTHRIHGNTESLEGFSPDGRVKYTVERKVLDSPLSGPAHVSRSVTATTAKIPVEERRRVVARLRAQDLTQAEIARRVGVSQVTVSNDLRACGETAERLSLDDARSLRGSGWEGDLEEMRTGRTA